jgi:hypothetical protein
MTLSAFIHYLIWRDPGMSVCGRAWERRHDPVWRVVVKVMGPRHCRQSWWWHRLR